MPSPDHDPLHEADGDAPAGLPLATRERYQLGVEIGRGGLGRVVEAYDPRLGRTVALKEALDDDGELDGARFLREAVITARLQHPGIVPIHEAGRWPSGAPFYVMQRVKGRTLDAVVTAATTPAARLALLPNVIAVGDAIAYAHSQGVIHRDLKPSNVLVGAFGETVVIDWGLAKELSAPDDDAGASTQRVASPDLTAAGAVVGTPAYMAPEQANGARVDERADVYALGALLYHVLAGRAPYAGASADEVLDAVAHGPPRPLGELAPGVPRDLLAVVERAMAHDPAARHPSARELTLELKRFAAGQLVASHHYSIGQLLRRWLRRRRAAVAVASSAAALLVIFAAVTLVRVVAERGHAERQRALAEQRRADVEELMGFMLFDLTDKLAEIGRVDILDAVAGKARQVYGEPADDATSDATMHRRSVTLVSVGDVLRGEGDIAGAVGEYRQAVAVAEQLAARAPTSRDAAVDAIHAHERISEGLLILGDTAGTLREGRAAQDLATARLAGAPDDPDWLRELAGAELSLAAALNSQGHPSEGLAAMRAALVLEQRRADRGPRDARLLYDLQDAYEQVGLALVGVGHVAEGFACLQAGLATAGALAARGDPLGPVAVAREQLTFGHALLELEPRLGLAAFRAALATIAPIALAEPGIAERQRQLAELEAALGDALGRLGDDAGALAAERDAVAITERLAAQDPVNAQRQIAAYELHASISRLLSRTSDVAGALAEERLALNLGERLLARDPRNTQWQSEVAGTHADLGALYGRQHDWPAGIAELRAVIAIREQLAALDPTNVDRRRSLAACHTALGDLLGEAHDDAAALVEYRAAMRLAQSLFDAEPASPAALVDVSERHADLAGALGALGDVDAALVEARAGLATSTALASREPDSPMWQVELATLHTVVGDLLRRRHDRRGAAREYRAALAIYARLRANDPSNPERTRALEELERKLR